MDKIDKNRRRAKILRERRAALLLASAQAPPSDLAIQTARAALNLPALPAGNAATTATPSAQSAQPSAPAVGNPAPTATPSTQSARPFAFIAIAAVSTAAISAQSAQLSASTLDSLPPSDVVTIPRALFEARAAELARLGIYEGMTKQQVWTFKVPSKQD
ncbi:MAG: Mating-type protein MAT alpha 1 [Aureobasidium pullulans]|nr:MAG: Mating-type protein MAT alpha 1 [Aureobasidium pullulans]